MNATGFHWYDANCLCISLQVFVIGMLIWVTVMGGDRWPFSDYPMFSDYRNPPVVRDFQLRFQMPEGAFRGFPKEAAHLPDQFQRAFHAVWPASPTANTVVLDFWKKACLFDPGLEKAQVLQVNLRVAQISPHGGVSLAEKAVHSVALPT